MKTYIPSGYSQTNDSFATLMVDAPEFAQTGISMKESFQALRLGIDSVIEKSRNTEATTMLRLCQQGLIEIEQAFVANAVANDPDIRKLTRRQLQMLYYDVYRKVAPLLKPGRREEEIGPDDDM